MAAKKKQQSKGKRRYRRLNTIKDLSKLDTHMIALHESYMAARRAGFSQELAFWLITEPGTVGLPDWIQSDKKNSIIPKIDETEEDED